MIDLRALDIFATDHIGFEALCTQCLNNPSLSNPPTDAETICGMDRIRTLIMNGSIETAWKLAQTLSQNAIDDPRVQLNVRIHKLFELLHIAENIPREKRDAYHIALQEALKYSQQLADFALNAFPEAYTRFTESMVTFAYPEQTSTADAIDQKRQKIADEVISLTRMTVRARESNFSFLIRYLLLIYSQFKSSVTTSAEENLDPLDDLIRELICCANPSSEITLMPWQTDLPRPTRFSHRAEYNEADVQALPERVDISRQESIESLKFTDGDVCVALKNELGRVLINRHCFRALVVDYCAARGLHVFDTTAEEAAPTGHQRQYPIISSDQQRIVVSENLVSSSSLKMFSAMHKLQMLAKNGDFDAFLQAVGQVDPIILEKAPLLDFQIAQCHMMRLIRCGEYREALLVSQQKLGPLAKRYLEFLPYLTEITTLLVFAADLDEIESMPKLQKGDQSAVKGSSNPDTERENRSGLSGDERIRHARLANTAFRTELAEVQSYAEFLREAFEMVTENASLDSITSEAYQAYQANYKEPQLVQLLKRLVSIHEQWQSHNMMTDRFSSELGINKIRGIVNKISKSMSGNVFIEMEEGGNETGGGNENSGQEAESTTRSARDRRREEQRESTVLTLMEFLEISRSDALAIVRNHPTAQNAQAILDSVLQ